MHNFDFKNADFNLVNVFLTLCETLSVTRAAQRLSLSQPAVSHALQRLRLEYDDVLFIRGKSELRMSARAIAMQPLLQEARQLIAQAMTPTQRTPLASLQRSFRLAMVDFIEELLLPRLLQTLNVQAPSLQLQCVTRPAATVEDLASEAVDLWIGPEPKGKTSVFRQHVFSDQFACAVRLGHPAVAAPMTPKQFAELRHIQIAPGGTPGGPLDDALKRLRLRREVTVRLQHFLVAPRLVQHSDLVLTAPASLLNRVRETHQLHLFAPPVPLKGFRLYQVWHARSHEDPAHRWLRTQVKNALL
jgi:DNA-binding transcriptional LysR family regulator